MIRRGTSEWEGREGAGPDRVWVNAKGCENPA